MRRLCGPAAGRVNAGRHDRARLRAPLQLSACLRPGNSYRYRITRRYFENGELKHTELAESRHRVLAGRPARERIAMEKLVRTAGGEAVDLSTKIARFPPYEASLAAGASADLLKLPERTRGRGLHSDRDRARGARPANRRLRDPLHAAPRAAASRRSSPGCASR